MKNIFQIYWLSILLISITVPGAGQRMAEKIDRGVVALTTGYQQVYVGWRLLENDPADVAFNVYRKEAGISADFQKINPEPVTASTNYMDTTVQRGYAYRYRIKRVVNGKEEDTPGEAYVFMSPGNQPWYSVFLKDKITVKNAGLGDLDGDGAYDFVLQHPDFSTDPYFMPGYWTRSPEPYKLDAYSSKGQLLWRYDMGWPIESGTWYAPFLIYDLDGDGLAEVYTKAGEGDPREADGHVLEGPEYLVKIDGKKGNVVQKKNWLSREGYGSYNYWSRNFLSVAYLDGRSPSLIMQRGTYTIIKTEAMDKNLKRQWYWESTGDDEKYQGQGSHGILVSDIDGDGKDELIPGTFALDDNGKPLWHLGLGHNDVGYVADIDPLRAGLEIFYGIETRSKENGVCLVDAASGELIWGFDKPTIHVHSQGMVGDIDPRYPGMECYAGDAKSGGNQYFLYSARGERLSDKNMGSLAPRPLWWDADEQKEINIKDRIFKYPDDQLQKIEGKVLFVADIIGDWREEIVTSLPGEIRIYSTTIPAGNKKVCLMQDHQYRMGVAAYSSGYMYPAQLGLPNKK